MHNIPPQVRAPLSVVAWIACSSGLILFNKRLLAGWFPFPIVLTMFHMLFASVVTWSLRFSGVVNTQLVTFAVYRKMFIPIAALFALSLILSNYAYLYLSVSFIQMLKASTPIVVLVLSFAAGLRKPSLQLTLVVVTVCVGVIMAAYGELLWSTIGVLLQIGGILVEASRLVTIQIVLKEVKLGPLDSLSLYAPACTLFLFTASLITGEFGRVLGVVDWHLAELLGNVLVAFALNLVTLWLVMETSSLVLTMCGVFKDILLIFLSKMIFASLFTRIQVIGYSISLVAIYVFNQLSAAPPPQHPLDEDGTRKAESPPWYSYLCSRHAIVGSFILLFFVSGLMMSDTSVSKEINLEPTSTPMVSPAVITAVPTPTATAIVPVEPAEPTVFCRKQRIVRFSCTLYGGTAGGVEALTQMYMMVKEVTRLLPFEARYNGLMQHNGIDGRFRERYRHELDIGYQHTPIDALGKDPDIFEVVFIPEVAACQDFNAPAMPNLTPANSLVYTWQLAHRPLRGSNCNYFSHTDFLRNDLGLHMEPWQLVRPYLDKAFYQPAMEAGLLRYDGSIDIKAAAPGKKNLILIDNDTPGDITHYLTEFFKGNATVTVVNGFSVPDLHRIYREAKVIVDWCLVGAERVPLESSLFGAVFVSSRCIGEPLVDFPVGGEFFLETKELMAAKIQNILQDWPGNVAKQDQLRSNIFDGKQTMRKDVFTFLSKVAPPVCSNLTAN